MARDGNQLYQCIHNVIHSVKGNDISWWLVTQSNWRLEVSERVVSRVVGRVLEACFLARLLWCEAKAIALPLRLTVTGNWGKLDESSGSTEGYRKIRLGKWPNGTHHQVPNNTAISLACLGPSLSRLEPQRTIFNDPLGSAILSLLWWFELLLPL